MAFPKSFQSSKLNCAKPLLTFHMLNVMSFVCEHVEGFFWFVPFIFNFSPEFVKLDC